MGFETFLLEGLLLPHDLAGKKEVDVFSHNSVVRKRKYQMVTLEVSSVSCFIIAVIYLIG